MSWESRQKWLTWASEGRAIDLVHDRESRAAGKRIQCPMRVVWGQRAKIEAWYDAVAIWQRYSDAEVTGGALPTNHYIPEEDPAGTLREMLAFFGPA